MDDVIYRTKKHALMLIVFHATFQDSILILVSELCRNIN